MSRSRRYVRHWRRHRKYYNAMWRAVRDDERTGKRRVRIYSAKKRTDEDFGAWLAELNHDRRMGAQAKPTDRTEGFSEPAYYPIDLNVGTFKD